jgi:hypothetical protein
MNFRAPKLLRDARDRSCLLRVPGICCGDPATVCAAHANWSEFGKGKSIKAHDWASARGCMTCHRWLDQGPAPRETKKRIWFAAWVRQLADWLRRGVIKTQLDLSNPDPTVIAEAFRSGAITV